MFMSFVKVVPHSPRLFSNVKIFDCVKHIAEHLFVCIYIYHSMHKFMTFIIVHCIKIPIRFILLLPSLINNVFHIQENKK